MFKRFQNDHATAFAHHEATAVKTERTACLRWIIFAFAQRRQAIEASDAKEMNHGVCAASHHDVGIAAAQNAECLTDRLRACRACGQAVVRRTTQIELARQVRKRHVRLLLNFTRRGHAAKRSLRPLHAVNGVGSGIPGVNV